MSLSDVAIDCRNLPKFLTFIDVDRSFKQGIHDILRYGLNSDKHGVFKFHVTYQNGYFYKVQGTHLSIWLRQPDAYFVCPFVYIIPIEDIFTDTVANHMIEVAKQMHRHGRLWNTILYYNCGFIQSIDFKYLNGWVAAYQAGYLPIPNDLVRHVIGFLVS